MSVEDDYRRRVIQENLVKLVDRLSPNELLPHLPCLSRQSQVRIRFEHFLHNLSLESNFEIPLFRRNKTINLYI